MLEISNTEMSARKITDQFGVRKTQILLILKNKSAILRDYEGADLLTKKRNIRKKTGNEERNSVSWKWF